jgi:molybdopterin-guanine dinucleotide biosynthesis protein MobB
MNRVHIVGRKNSGKTTLIVELVEYLSGQGYQIGTIKHTHHHHELDTPGKDSHRHREAGAAAVGILSPGMSAVFRPAFDSPDSSERYADMAPLFANCEIVLVEGDLQTTAKKVEVWRAAAAPRPIAHEDPSIMAVVTDDPIDIAVSVWRRSDIASVAKQLLASTSNVRDDDSMPTQ